MWFKQEERDRGADKAPSKQPSARRSRRNRPLSRNLDL